MDQDFIRFGLSAFVTLLVVVDPPGVVPIFVAPTKDEQPAQRRKILIRAVLIAFGVALFFLVAGRAVLSYLGVTVHAFRHQWRDPSFRHSNADVVRTARWPASPRR